MKNVSGRFGYVCAVVALLAASTAAQDSATISLKAIKVNGIPITPTNELTNALPGDVIYAEFYASDWSFAGQECKVWQVTMMADDVCSFFSGPCGMVTPFGWDRPAECLPIFCDPEGPDECPGDLECHTTAICAGPDHDPLAGIFLDIERPDYIFYGRSGISDYDPVQYRYGGMVWADPYPAYEAPPKYLSTLILEASNDACGEFVIDFIVGVGYDTMLLDGYQNQIPVTLEPLTIRFSEPPPPVERTYPPNCAIDARQPHEPDGSSLAAWESIDFYFCPGSDLSEITPSDFGVRRIPISFPPPWIHHIDVDDDNDVVTVVVDGPFKEQVWTCVDYDTPVGEPGDNEVCVGVLPGDVDNDRFAAQIDATRIINHLTGAPTGYELYQCDIDRSGRCTAADLIRQIDLLNGGDAYAPGYVGAQMDPRTCPSAPQQFPACPPEP